MRDTFAAEITALAEADPRVVLLSGDIGNKLFDKFKAVAPDRFFNCGVAEANMMSMAAGMAMCGLRPVVYTITPFVTTRCLEQIRVDVCYHEQPVVIVGVGAGLSYAANGATHHSCEDIAFLRALPGMSVLCPGDQTEVRLGLRAALEATGPVYMRIGKKGEPRVHTADPPFQLGKAIRVRDGVDACLIATGNLLPTAMRAAELLSAQDVSCEVVSMHTVKPLDEACLGRAFGRFRVIVTLEEHSRIGGLGGSIAEWLADQPPQRGRLTRIGTPDAFFHEAGEQEHARERLGLTPAAVAERILHAVLELRRPYPARRMAGRSSGE